MITLAEIEKLLAGITDAEERFWLRNIRTELLQVASRQARAERIWNAMKNQYPQWERRLA